MSVSVLNAEGGTFVEDGTEQEAEELEDSKPISSFDHININ